MAAVAPCTYRIDAADRIRHVSEGWVAFARENHGEAILPPAILGQVLWDSIKDSTTREIYRSLLKRLRERLEPTRFRFRCDSPSTRRLLEMRLEVSPDGSVTFTTTGVNVEARDAIALLDPTVPRTEDLLTTCAWCARVRIPSGSWREVEDAVRVLDLFGQAAMPRLSHGICPTCFAAMERELADEARAAGELTTLGAFDPG